MFMGSTMQNILNQTSKIAEELNIPIEYRDPVVKYVGNISHVPKLQVIVGEINMNCSYILEFKRDVLQAIFKEDWGNDGNLYRRLIK